MPLLRLGSYKPIPFRGWVVDARELLLIEKNIKNLERIIFFYNIPEKLVDEEEAKCIAKEILKVEPDNGVALSVQMS